MYKLLLVEYMDYLCVIFLLQFQSHDLSAMSDCSSFWTEKGNDCKCLLLFYKTGSGVIEKQSAHLLEQIKNGYNQTHRITDRKIVLLWIQAVTFWLLLSWNEIVKVIINFPFSWRLQFFNFLFVFNFLPIIGI